MPGESKWQVSCSGDGSDTTVDHAPLLEYLNPEVVHAAEMGFYAGIIGYWLARTTLQEEIIAVGLASIRVAVGQGTNPTFGISQVTERPGLFALTFAIGFGANVLLFGMPAVLANGAVPPSP